MRKIKSELIKQKVKRLAIEANIHLREDVLTALKKARQKETHHLAQEALSAIIENAGIAREKKLAICQDTGLPVIFLELGSEVCLDADITDVITGAVEEGYKNGYFRASIQKDVLFRREEPAYKPVIIHTDIVKGKKLKVTLLPKGFGSENKSKVKMFNPTTDWKNIESFIVDAVRIAGADACPPYIVGVGIGGTIDYACLLAKKALLRKIKIQNSKIKMTNQNSKISNLEEELLSKINKLNIGPMGFGGKTTALGVNIETYPTHIAGLPVAVNISCHALRSASTVI